MPSMRKRGRLIVLLAIVITLSCTCTHAAPTIHLGTNKTRAHKPKPSTPPPVLPVGALRTPTKNLTAREIHRLTRTLSGRSAIVTTTLAHPAYTAFVTDYATFHNAHRRNMNARRLIYQLHTGQPGLGDRFTGLLTAYVHAVITRRVLLIDWRTPFPLREVFAPGVIDAFWTMSDIVVNSGAHARHCDHAACLEDILSASERTVFVNVTMPLRLGDAVRLAIRRGHVGLRRRLGCIVHARGLQTDGTVYAGIFDALFRPTDAFASFLGSHAGTLLYGGFVAAHARLGVGVGEGGPRFRNVNHTCVAVALLHATRAHLRSVPARNRLVFLATDTQSFRTTFAKRVMLDDGGSSSHAGYESSEHVSVGGVVAGDWMTTHVSHLKKGVRRQRTLFWTSVLELVVLGRADVVVGMGSRFADVGAWFGGVPSVVGLGLHDECGTRNVRARRVVRMARH